MSRDFIRIISPHTEPVLIHQWALGDQSFIVTFLWLNPYGKLANVTSVKIDESALVSSFIHFKLYNFTSIIYFKF